MQPSHTSEHRSEKHDLAPGEWSRIPRSGETLRGLSRGFIYELIANKAVQSIVLTGAKREGRKTARGVRLIYLPSLDAYLKAQLKQPTGAAE